MEQLFRMDPSKIIDFAPCSVSRENIDECHLKSLALFLYDALSTDGIAILKNHGIETDKFRQTFRAACEFYQLPTEKKVPCAMLEESIIAFGYIPVDHDIKKSDVFQSTRELFRYHPTIESEILLDDFKDANKSLFNDMTDLFKQTLKPLALALNVDEKDLTEKFKHVGKSENHTQLLHNWYPTSDKKDDNDPVKLGVHYDSGMITFLVTSDEPGLQFQDKSGEWVDVPLTKDGIIMIIGKQMEMWSEDRLKAAIHRVVLPANQPTHRQSCGFFVYADSNEIIQGIYGGDKYTSFCSTQLRIDVAKARYKIA